MRLPNFITLSGTTPAFVAAYKGRTDTLLSLIKAGCDVNRANENGTPLPVKSYKSGVTPAFVAAFKGHTEALIALIQAGSDVNLVRNDGIAPVHSAAWGGHTDTLKVLIAAGISSTQAQSHYTRLRR